MSDDRYELKLTGLDLSALGGLAQSMLRRLPSSLVIGLVGTLGAGKTTLVQAIARAAGIDAADVTSPTFTLLQTYQGSIALHHLDAYRVADEEEFLQLGVDELFEDAAWTIIEWADRVADVLPGETLWIELDHGTDDNTRDVKMHANCDALSEPMNQIEADLG